MEKMSKNKKILLGLLMIFVLGITGVLLGDSKREYVGEITTEELDVIRNEVIKELPEKYKCNSSALSPNTSQILLQFENLKELEIRFGVKRICIKSENVRGILDKYHIKRHQVLDLFILDEGPSPVFD